MRYKHRDSDWACPEIQGVGALAKNPDRQYAGLADEEVAALGRDGDEAARLEAVVRNAGMIVDLGKKFQGVGAEAADLWAAGVWGVCRAVDRFRPDGGAKFSHYAYLWIRASISREANGMRNGFHAHSKTFAKRAVIVREDAAVAPAGRLTDAEMAARLGTLPCVVRGIRATERMVSLDSDVGTDSGLEAPGAIKDCLGGDDPAFGEIDMKHDFDAIMAIAKEVLTERERYVVRRSVMEGASNIAIGKEIGRSHERARQIREEALDKVRRARAKREVAV